jgi:ADP-ribose pyrophosphatase
MSDRILHSERLFDGKKISVDRIEVVAADNSGRTVVREKVIHPGAVIVLPLLDDGRVVMIRNHRYVVGEDLYELCAGTLEPGEPAEDCASRELTEETGYEAATIQPLCGFYTSPGFCDEFMHAFTATDLTQVGQQLEATEQITIELLAMDDVLAMIRDGRIRDGKTISTLLYHCTFSR